MAEMQVVDRALRDGTLMSMLDPPLRRRIVERVPRAKRFVLTDPASVRFGEIVKASEGLMLGNTQFALPPFDDCYIEVNNSLLYQAAGKPVAMGKQGEADTDNRVGFLVHKRASDGAWEVVTFSITHNGDCAMGPFVYYRYGHRPSCSLSGLIDIIHRQSRDEYARIKAISPQLEVWARLALLLGSGLSELPSEEVRLQIEHEWTMQPTFEFAWPYRSADQYACSTGDIRNLLCLLLLLNQPQLYKLVSVKHSHGLYKGRRTVYAGHSVVEISLGQRKLARRIFDNMGPRNSPKRHEVRGHFAHWHLRDGCTHDWPVLPDIGDDDTPRWSCKHCQGLRVWREHHLRGDASKGFVEQEYKLT